MSAEKVIKNISDFPGIKFITNASWKDVTTLGVGGKIPAIAEPENDIALTNLLKYCHSEKIPVFVLGAGSNTVGMDDPFQGIVLRLSRNVFSMEKTGRKHVTAGAGAKLYDFTVTAAEHGFGGYSHLAAIPGSIGGALRMNAGAGGVNISDYLSEICGFDMAGNPWSAESNEIKWGYRNSSIPEDVIITAAIFKMPHEETADELENIKNAILARKTKDPKGRSAGCVFKNIPPDNSAGKLIDISGCKKLENGGVEVSEVHANYFINKNGASENSFIELAKKVRTKVFENTGIYLFPEVRFVNGKSRKELESTPQKFKINVLKGGNSSEREVSLESGSAVANALKAAGYEIFETDIKELAITGEMKKADVVFPVLHGGFGENGEIQKLLENAKINFIGCGSKASEIIIDKVKSKKLMDEKGIQTPPYAVLESLHDKLPEHMKLPLVVKPPTEGSTVGISIVHTEEQWDNAVEDAFKLGSNVLVEQYIAGTEITVGIIDGRALPVIEIKYPGEMYDYDAKYTHVNGETLYLCPPENVNMTIQKKAMALALDFYNATGSRDILRVDIIVDENEDMFVLEGNSMPGFTSSSLVPKAAKVSDISFVQLCASLARKAIERK
jgi:UDP-N-acetylenolpyruvoylglucosamine reductase